MGLGGIILRDINVVRIKSKEKNEKSVMLKKFLKKRDLLKSKNMSKSLADTDPNQTEEFLSPRIDSSYG